MLSLARWLPFSSHDWWARRGTGTTEQGIPRWCTAGRTCLYLVAHEAPDLDDVALHVIVEDLEGLRDAHAARQQLDEVPGLDYDVGVAGLARR